MDPAGRARGRPGRLARPRPRPGRLGGRRGPGRTGPDGTRRRAAAAPAAGARGTVATRRRGRDRAPAARRGAVPRRLLDQLYPGPCPATAWAGRARAIRHERLASRPIYQKALDLRPKAVAVHNNLGLVLVDVGWLEDNADGRWGPGAITIFRRALRIDPDFAPARNNLGLCLKRAGDWMTRDSRVPGRLAGRS